MDSYLDPSLAGALAYLDQGAGLHPGADAATMSTSTPLLSAFDYDQWINPQATVAYHAQPGSSVLQHSAHHAPHPQRDHVVPSHHPFGPLHSETAGSATRLAAAPPLEDANAHQAADIELIYGPGDYEHEMFAAAPPPTATATSTPARARSTSSHQPYPAQPQLSLDDRKHDLIVDDVSSYSIAAYGDGSAAGSPVAKRTSADAVPSPVPSPRVQRSPAKVYAVKASPAPVVVAAKSTGTSSGTHTPKTPQADQSVPEAALHLLRLAQPDGSTTGSVATASTGGREDEASCDEDAEGESDDTSIHSVDAQAKRPLAPVVAQQGQLETRVWQHDPAQPPLHVQRGGGPGSRRPSASESVASTRTGRPAPSVARTQREASVASNRSRAVSDAASTTSGSQQPQQPVPAVPSPATRRTSGRVRKPRVSDVAADVSSDMSEDEHEYKPDDADVDMADDSDGGRASSSKKKGKGPAAKGKKPAKRTSSAGVQGGSAAKKARTTRGSSPNANTLLLAPRKPRRQAYIPANLQNRAFPPHVELSDLFPRFYRSFPVSSAFPPDSFVIKASKQPSQPAGLVASTSSGSNSSVAASPYDVSTASLHGMYDDSAFAAAQYYSGAHTPVASTSSLADPTVQFSSLGYLPMPHSLSYSPPQHQHQHHALPALSPALSATSSIAATPFSSQASVSTPPSTIASTSSTPSTAATPTALGPNGISVMLPPPDAKWNKGGEPLNLYWPRFVKGNADEKCGLCPICAEPKERGGEGEQKWLKLKNSSYVYHMSYTHGLSNLTGLPFSPPVEMRTVTLPPSTKDQRAQMVEGKCHKCNDWIKLLSVKNIDAIVPELIWWKHAKKCHGQSQIEGEGLPYQQDEVYALILQRKAECGVE
ncbi:hypothetical protein JCM9279_004257 [Rhodotorula babjevae]